MRRNKIKRAQEENFILDLDELSDIGPDEDFGEDFEDDFEEGAGGETPSKDEVIDWFKEHKNPSDEEIMAWAEEEELDVEALQLVIYEIVTDHIELLEEDEGDEEEEEADEEEADEEEEGEE